MSIKRSLARWVYIAIVAVAFTALLVVGMAVAVALLGLATAVLGYRLLRWRLRGKRRTDQAGQRARAVIVEGEIIETRTVIERQERR